MSGYMKDRLFRGYGPLIGFAAIFLAVVLLVPSQVPDDGGALDADGSSVVDLLGEDGDASGALDEEGVALGEAGVDPETGEPLDATAVGDAGGAGGGGPGGSGPGGTGSGGPGGGGSGGSGGGSGGSPGGGAGGARQGPPKVAGCGAAQVPGDPYSPPCIRFSGGNGGATSRGVTGNEIVVTARLNGLDDGLVDAVTAVAAQKVKLPSESTQKVVNTLTGLVEYFNTRFQFYGRKIKLVVYRGKGNVLNEIISAGQEGAQADATKVAKEHKAFAEVAALSIPYAQALAQQGVVNIGAPYTSRSWLAARKGYSWTPLTDCTTVVESTVAYYANKMHGRPARNAGTLKGRPLSDTTRKTVVIYPDNPEYKSCVDAGFSLLSKRIGGAAVGGIGRLSYKLSVDSSEDAYSILNKVVAGGYTTVLCGCDPIFLAYLTARMNARDVQYFPEMLTAGVALVDNDIVGSLMDQKVWRNAFGVSFAGATRAQQETLGYRAYRSVRSDQPSLGVDLIYQQLYMLAIGIQMAGPNLTPGTFAKGMFDYPTRSGEYGRWGFGPGDFSTSDDAREIHWNPEAVSKFTRTRGAWVDSNGGRRFAIGQFPSGQPTAYGR